MTTITITLGQVAARWQTIEDALEESGGEVTPEIDGALAELLGAEADKVDAYGFAIRSLEGQEESLKKLEAEMAGKRAVVSRRKEWLLARMAEYLRSRGGDLKVKGAVYTFALQQNGGAAPLDLLVPPEALPEGFKRVQVAADLDAIRRVPASEGGIISLEGQPVAMVLPRGRHLRLR